MASSSLTRFVLTSKQTLTVLSRSYTSLASSPTSLSKACILRYRPIFAGASHLHRISPATSTRSFATRPASSSLSDPNPNWSNRPPKETILLDGCDFEHWLVVVDKPAEDLTRDDIIASYIKTLAEVIGSEEEARMKIYSVSTRHYFAFGALVSEELSYKLKDLPGVRWVLPDSYLHVRNKDYGGEPFINGEAVPYDPKYHEDWVRNNARANDRRPPRNVDRPRSFERRRVNVQSAGGSMSGPPNTLGGGAPSNMQQQNAGRGNVGGPAPYVQPRPPGPGGYPPNNQNFQGGAAGGYPPNNQSFQPGPGGYQPNNTQNFQPGPPGPGGYQPNNAQNFQQGGGPLNYQSGGAPNNGGPNYYQPRNGPLPNPAYQNQGPSYQNLNQNNIPGRDDVPSPNYR